MESVCLKRPKDETHQFGVVNRKGEKKGEKHVYSGGMIFTKCTTSRILFGYRPTSHRAHSHIHRGKQSLPNLVVLILFV